METHFLTVEQASEFTGLSKSSIYKLTANRVIEFYKPTGKKIWFSREQLISFLTRNKYQSKDVLTNEALNNKKLHKE